MKAIWYYDPLFSLLLYVALGAIVFGFLEGNVYIYAGGISGFIFFLIREISVALTSDSNPCQY